MRRLWLLFAQTATVGLALWFIVTTLKPNWTGQILGASQSLRLAPSVTIQEAPTTQGGGQTSYRAGAKLAMPSVVNINTAKESRRAPNASLNDPFLKRFFGNQPDPQSDRQSSLGSGVIISPEGFILTNYHVI